MTEQHADHFYELRGVEVIHSRKYPNRLGECKDRDPSSFRYEVLRQGNLAGIIPDDQAQKNISINRAHSAFERIPESPLSVHEVFALAAFSRRRLPDGYLL